MDKTKKCKTWEKKRPKVYKKQKNESEPGKKWTRAKTKWTRAKQLRRQVTDKCCLPVARKCTFCHQELSKPFPSPPGAEQLCPLCDHYKLSNNVLYEMSKPFPSPPDVAHLRRLSDVQYRYNIAQQCVETNCDNIVKSCVKCLSLSSWCGTVVPTLWCAIF